MFLILQIQDFPLKIFQGFKSIFSFFKIVCFLSFSTSHLLDRCIPSFTFTKAALSGSFKLPANCFLSFDRLLFEPFFGHLISSELPHYAVLFCTAFGELSF